MTQTKRPPRRAALSTHATVQRPGFGSFGLSGCGWFGCAGLFGSFGFCVMTGNPLACFGDTRLTINAARAGRFA